MRWISLGLLLLIAFTLSAIFILSRQPKSLPPFVAPDNWKEIDLGCFLFYLPPDMKPEKVQGIDSEVWAYSNNSIQLDIERGMYSGDLEAYIDKPEYKEEWVIVGSKTAHFGTYRSNDANTASAIGDKTYHAAICFKSMNLTFWAYCRTKSDLEIAEIIFQSIKFK